MAPLFVSAFSPSPRTDDHDDDLLDPDSSFSSDASSTLPLLSSSSSSLDDGEEEYDEKTGESKLPFSRQDLKAKAQDEEEDKRSGRRRTVKALLLVVVMAGLSAALYKYSDRIPEEWKSVGWTKMEQGGKAPDYPPLLGRTASNASFIEHPADFNSLFPKLPLDYDRELFIENLRPSIPSSTRSSIIFHCRHSEPALCATAYRVLLVGPTIVSPLYQQSTVLDEDGRRVEVEFEVKDPGMYEVWAWPEHDSCDAWNHGEGRPYHKLAVMGTPAKLEVTGEAPLDSPALCTLADDLTAGRWISKAYLNPDHHSPASVYYSWLESHYVPRPVRGLMDYSSYGYVWAPYSCKPHHHSWNEWIDVVQPERLVVFGDSVMRDLFCQNLEAGEEVCKYEMFGHYEQDDKYVPHRRSDGSTSHLHFHWEPLGDPARLEAFFTSLETPATHIFFNVALWLTRENPDAEVYAQRMKPLLDRLLRVAPGAKIVARTTAGAVQAIACFDLWRIQRRILEPANAALLTLLEDYPTIQPLDVYPLYNNRPDASQDGRHWQRLSATDNDRPEEGAVGFAAVDLIMESWRLQQEKEEEMEE
ncbi:hypothetical protein JCM8547_006430 [Rhodosporidiobolus lusitaniae]